MSTPSRNLNATLLQIMSLHDALTDMDMDAVPSGAADPNTAGSTTQSSKFYFHSASYGHPPTSNLPHAGQWRWSVLGCPHSDTYPDLRSLRVRHLDQHAVGTLDGTIPPCHQSTLSFVVFALTR